MQERWRIGEHVVEVHRRSRQRTLRLRVQNDGTLKVTCAGRVSRGQISDFILEQQEFVAKCIMELRRARARFPAIQFVAGETLFFLGQPKQLKVKESVGRLKMLAVDGALVLNGPIQNFNERRAAVQNFYRRCGRQYMNHRVEFWSRIMGLAPRRLSFRSQSSRWGSCSSAGHISLNWRLIAAPAAVLDYVIIHELAHLVHANHGPHFWQLVTEFSPNFRERKAWLRENHWALEFLSKDYRSL